MKLRKLAELLVYGLVILQSLQLASSVSLSETIIVGGSVMNLLEYSVITGSFNSPLSTLGLTISSNITDIKRVNSTMFAVSSDSAILLYSTSTLIPTCVNKFDTGHPVSLIAVDSYCRVIITASIGTTAKVFSLNDTSVPIAWFEDHTNYIIALITLPYTELAITTAYNELFIWNFYTGSQYSSYNSPDNTFYALCAISDTQFAAGDDTASIIIWSVLRDQSLVINRTISRHSNTVRCIIPYSSNLYISSDEGGFIAMWRLSDGNLVYSDNSLNSNAIYRMVITSSQELVVSTTNKISSFQLNSSYISQLGIPTTVSFDLFAIMALNQYDPTTTTIDSNTFLSTQSEIRATLLQTSTSTNPVVRNILSGDLLVSLAAIVSLAQYFNQAITGLNSTIIQYQKDVNSVLIAKIDSLDQNNSLLVDLTAQALSELTRYPNLVNTDDAALAIDICLNITSTLSVMPSALVWTLVESIASDIIEASANALEAINLSRPSTEQIKEAMEKQTDIINQITKIASSSLLLGNSVELNSQYIQLQITKDTLSQIPTQLDLNNCTMKFATSCQILGQPAGCSDVQIVQQVFTRTKALSLNENVHTNMSMSMSVSYFYSNMSQISVENSQDGFYLWTKMNASSYADDYSLVNTSSISISALNQLQVYSFQLDTANQSVRINLKPDSSVLSSIAYLACLKYGQKPVVNSTTLIYDSAKIFCPADLTSFSGHQVYTLFSNTSSNTNMYSYVAYGFRELTNAEFNQYCSNSSSGVSSVPQLPDSYNFKSLLTHQVSRQVIGLGFYYIDTSSTSYSSWQVSPLADSNLTHIHGYSTHLTEFAGGLIILPDSIDFNNVWANASFTRNLTIYLTVIIICSIYMLLLVPCLFMDRKDDQKRNMFVLTDNSWIDNYLYELIVFTGNRRNAGTKSNVFFILSSDQRDSSIRQLKPISDKGSRPFQRGSIDSFIMSVESPLGQLLYLRIWHDNSGQGNSASWFLKFIIVHDLQTRDKSYFICNEWLAIDQSDSQTDRILHVATSREKHDLAYMMKKQTKDRMSENHLWYSILARPIQSSFSRVDRLTCAFTFLCLTMLMNIMYYGTASSSSSNSLEIGPFSLSSSQIMVGVICNLVIFPPSFLLLQLFRITRKRETKSDRIRKYISIRQKLHGTQKPVNEKKVKPKRFNLTKVSLPWWFKIIGYTLSAAIVTVCLFFTISKGISFGDDLCRKWLTSFLVSITTSVLLTQPLQVMLMSVFFVLLFRKPNDQNDIEQDSQDDGKPMNEFTESKISKQNTRYDLLRLEQSPTRQDVCERERQKRLDEKRASMFLKKIAIYAVFLFVLFTMAYTKTDKVSYNYQAQLKHRLTSNLTLVKTANDVWSWLGDEFLDAIVADKWYNSAKSDLNRYIKDYTSIVVGSVIIRQARVKGVGCSTKANKPICYGDYSVTGSQSADYYMDWSSSYISSSTSSSVQDAFKYTSALSINSLPYSGVYTNYLGGGYVYQMNTATKNTSQLASELVNLQQNDWIDESTRAVFVEFTLFNVNLELFAYCVILFEFMSTGNIVTSYQFDPLTLYSDDSIFILVLSILYMFLVTFCMLKEIKLLINLRKAYFTHYWSYIEWTIVAFSWASFALYLLRLNERYKLGDQIKSAVNYQTVINFQTANYLNQMLLMCLGLCCFLASFKILKFVRFSRTIDILSNTFAMCFREMLFFILIYLIIFFAFTQMMYLIACDRNSQFQSFAVSVMTGFLMIIGKFNVDSFTRDVGSIVGCIIYSSFVITMAMILLNMFISIFTDNFTRIRADSKKRAAKDSLIWLYIKAKLSRFAGHRYTDGTAKETNKKEYHTVVMNFKDRTQTLAQQIDILGKKDA